MRIVNTIATGVAIILFMLQPAQGMRICTDRIRQGSEANVFLVDCQLSMKLCVITGYLSNVDLLGYNGVVAVLQPDRETQKSDNLIEAQRANLLIRTYKNGYVSARTSIPRGYFVALETAQKMLAGEVEPNSLYLDATTGEEAPRPDIEFECAEAEH